MSRRTLDTPEIPIAPMIDCVFLMLVYFMTTSSLEKSEADLAFPVGEAGIGSDPLPAVDEQELSVNGAGEAFWNGATYALLEAGGPASIEQRLETFRQSCVAAQSDPSIRINPEGEAPHQAIVTLLDAIVGAGIEAVHFP